MASLLFVACACAGGRSAFRLAGVAFCFLVASSPLAPAQANAVLDWAEIGEHALANAPGSQSVQAKLLARIAMFNALNAITPRYQSYAPAPDPAPDAAADAAVASAAWTALGSVPGADRALLDERLRATLARVPDGPAKIAGVALGKRVAMALLLARAGDHFDALSPTPRDPGPGVYALTPEHKRPSSVHWINVRPFAIRSLAICEPGPPPAWDSAKAVRDTLHVKSVGGQSSAVRTADQTAAALFWNSTDDTDEIAMLKAIAEVRKLSELDTARLLALFGIAGFDGNICNAVIKEKYRSWRPYNAIRGPYAIASLRDEAWMPLITTPANPDYPSNTASLAGIYERLFRAFNPGNAVPLAWRNRATKQTRGWPTAEAMSEEVAMSRIWAGIHSQSAVDAGLLIGRRLADEVLATQLLPLER